MARKVTWHHHADPCERLRDAEVARQVAGPHESTQMPGWRRRGMSNDKLADDGPTSIVDPGDSIAVVTHLR